MDPDQVRDLFRFVGGKSLVGRLAVLAGLAAPEEAGRSGPELVALGRISPAQLADLEAQEAEVLRADRGEPAGRALGPYLLVETLGTGATAVVWKAWDTKLRRWVAVKEARLGSPASRERFLREARAASKVRHPNLVEAFDVGREGDVDYVVMGLVEGRPLDQSRPDARGAAAAVADVAGAVHALHEAGLIHRDVKPQNILVDAAGRAVLADLGIARDLGAPALTVEGSVLGTPHYMAPEQAAGKAAGPAADVYGLGATLYHLASGRPPFDGDLRARAAAAAPLRGAPRALEAVVRRAMEPEPADRYPSAAAMADDLRRFLRGEPVRAGSGLLRKLRRRLPWVAAAALLAFAAVRAWSAAELGRLTGEGMELWIRGDLAAAERLFARAERRPDAALLRGRCLDRMGRPDEALAVWDRLLEAHPDYGPALVERGRRTLSAAIHRLLPRGRAGRGRVRFEAAAVAPDPDLARAGSARGLAAAELRFLDGERALRSGDFAGAERALGEFATSRPWDAEAHSIHAAAALLAGDLAAADAALTKAIGVEPHPDRFRARGDARFALGRFDAALEDYARAGDEARRGLALQALGRLAEAEAAFDLAVASAPSARTLVNRGAVRAGRRNLAGARKDFEDALELDERSADAYHNLAGVQVLEGALDDALRHYDLALAMDPGFAEAWAGRARLRLRTGHPEKAVADLEEALRLEGDDPDLLLEAASASHLAGERAKALDRLRRALEAAPPGWASRPGAQKLLEEWSR
jgi:tetratricopeptide (TPR) repeat protein